MMETSTVVNHVTNTYYLALYCSRIGPRLAETYFLVLYALFTDVGECFFSYFSSSSMGGRVCTHVNYLINLFSIFHRWPISVICNPMPITERCLLRTILN